MSRNLNVRPIFARIPDTLRVRRFREILEGAFAHLSRKPEHLYAVRQEKTTPIFERHLNEYRTLLRAGASPSHIMNGIEAVALEVEYETQVATTHQAFASVEDVYSLEVETECKANHLQLVARCSQSPADLDAAINATDEEVRVTKMLARSLRARRAAQRAIGLGGQQASNAS